MVKSHRVLARHWLDLVLGRTEPVDDSQRRYARALQTGLTGLGGRGLGLLVSLASVPLTIGYLGSERYGAWVTVSTLAYWLTLADFGVSNGLLNGLAQAYGAGDRERARHLVASGFWMLVLVSMVLAAALAVMWPLADWADLLNVSSAIRKEVDLALAAALALALLGLPVAISTRVWQARQEGSTANFWAAVASIGSLVGLLLVVQTRGGLVALVLGFSGVPVLVAALSTVWLFGVQQPWLRPSLRLARRQEMLRTSRTALEFLVLQIAFLALFYTDNVVIARFLGPGEVTRYSVPYRLFSYVPMVHGLFLAPLWPAYTEAVSRGDWEWIARAFRRTLVLGMGAATLAILVVSVCAGPLLALWTRGQVSADPWLLVFMAVWAWMWTFGQTLAFLQNGLGHVRIQALTGVAVAVVNLALSICWVHTFGIVGVILATVVAYGALALPIMPLDVLAVFRRNAVRWRDERS